eukprot:gnl/TRDRNA2_/TRDRNA2_31371_c0_seq1.p1 gnl/TRDRNA2_/TRDRNA2_31371_c0~~gnl/TRDRNA2_/TRDRNA2_31371_c0_seq1.p1  ORF type:complete len:293 (+),score=30.68 gnl/TRDRNA2_/TRDRNA2_31371_c0_seq1:146-1024(+)
MDCEEVPNAVDELQSLLHPESLLLPLAALLGPLDTWRLRVLASWPGRVLLPHQLSQLRTVWCNEADPAVPLVDLVRSADPGAAPQAKRALVKVAGVAMLVRPHSALSPNAAGQTALSWAADYGLEELLGVLISPLGALEVANRQALDSALNLVESNGWYPLFRAAWGGRTRCVRMLLEVRADAEGVQGAGRGYSPLMAAARWGHKETVAALLAARAVPSRKNARGENALSLAQSQGHQEILRLLRCADASDSDPTESEAEMQRGCKRASSSVQVLQAQSWEGLAGTKFHGHS